MREDRRRWDSYSRRAQHEGKAARSVYKLEEMDQRWKLLKKGDRVLDLGAAPGSWLQYAAHQVSTGGQVVGLDLQPLGIDLPAHVRFWQTDVWDWQGDGERFDVVLSDMAPSTLGHHATDAMRSAALVERALDIAQRVLRVGGHVVVKLLEGKDVGQLVQRMKGSYRKLERLRPQATRKASTELFLVGLHKKV